MDKNIKKSIDVVLGCLCNPLLLIAAYFISFCLRSRIGRNTNLPRLVWGSTPIISYAHWSKAMKLLGYDSETYTNKYYGVINRRDDWDRVLAEQYPGCPWSLKRIVAFIHSLFLYDIFIISFDGYFLGNTWMRNHQARLLRLAGKKVVVIPYGSDSYVYRRIHSSSTLHGLLMSYPAYARKQHRIQESVDYWCENADAVITGLMGPDGFGRWDVLTPCPFCINLDDWTPSTRSSFFNGKDGVVTIAHAPNHRGFKGTEFVIDSINKLREEGLKIELILIEKKQNTEVRRILREDTDILVEQIIATGHALNGLEGMASGLPTISNFEDDQYILPFRRWSFFDECPIVSATPENITETLRKLITQPELRRQLGNASRAYAEKYHGLDSSQYLFTNVIDFVTGKKDSIINLYHPLLGEYPNRLPKIHHPLHNNHIVD